MKKLYRPNQQRGKLNSYFLDNPKIWIIYDKGYSETYVNADKIETTITRPDRIYFYDDYFDRDGNELCLSERNSTYQV
jgi:hypothetical protein